MRKVILICLLILLLARGTLASVKILENGIPQVRVVTPATPEDVLSRAITDFFTYTNKATGKNFQTSVGPNTLQILDSIPSDAPDDVKAVLNANKEAYCFESIGTTHRIYSAGPVGACFGIYDWLRRYFDVRWYLPATFTGGDGEVCPNGNLTNVTADDGYLTSTPRFPMRWVGVNASIIDWSRRNGNNVHGIGTLTSSGQQMDAGFAQDPRVYGTQEQLFPRATYFAAHPEWFALVNGSRQDLGSGTKLCLSNTAMQTEFAAQCGRWIDNHPGVQLIMIAMSDGNNWCECPVCAAWYESGGSSTNTWTAPCVRFYNAVIHKVRETRPNAEFTVGFYARYQSPPAQTSLVLEPNVNLFITHYSPVCLAHGIANPSCDRNGDFRNDLIGPSGWMNRVSGTGNPGFFLYEYYWKNAWCGLPMPIVHKLSSDFDFMANNSGKGLYTQCTANNAYALGLNYYVAARLLWDPTQSTDGIVTDFCSRYYAENSATDTSDDRMHEYYDLLEARMDAVPGSFRITGDVALGCAEVFSRDLIVNMLRPKLIAALAGTTSETVRRRIRRQMRYLEYVEPVVWGYECKANGDMEGARQKLEEAYTLFYDKLNVAVADDSPHTYWKGLIDSGDISSSFYSYVNAQRTLMGMGALPRHPNDSSYVAPKISNVKVTGIQPTGATITWTSTTAGDTQVEYDTNAGTPYAFASPLNATAVTSHSVTLAGLTAGTVYYFRTRSAISGTPYYSADYRFETPGSSPPSFIMESRSGGQNYSWYSDGSMTDWAPKSTAQGASFAIGTRSQPTSQRSGSASFQPSLSTAVFPANGFYRVHATWSSNTYVQCSHARAVFTTDSTWGGPASTTSFFDQDETTGNQWVQISSAPLPFSGSDDKVVLDAQLNSTNDGSFSFQSDAVKFEYYSPLPPINTTASGSGPHTVTLTWSNPAFDCGAISIYRSSTSGTLGARVKTLVGSSWTDEGLSLGTVYYYTLRAVSAGLTASESPNTNQVTATTSRGGAETARQRFDRLDIASFTGTSTYGSSNEDGSFAWGTAYVMQAYMVMYDKTRDPYYLNRFVVVADYVISKRDDKLGKADSRGVINKAWGASGKYTLSKLDLKDSGGHAVLRVRGIAWANNNYTKVTVTTSGSAFSITVSNSVLGGTETYGSLTNTQSSLDTVNNSSALIRLESLLPGALPVSIPATSTIPERYVYAVHTGMIVYPMAQFAAMAGNLAGFSAKARIYLQAAQDALACHENEWREDAATGTGWYVQRTGAPVWTDGCVVPQNQYAVVGSTYAALYAATGKPQYRDRVEKLGRNFRNTLSLLPNNSYKWHYWWGNMVTGWEHGEVDSRNLYSYAGFDDMEDISHAGLDLQFAIESFRLGVVFTNDDMVRLARTCTQNIVRAGGEYSYFVDGTVTCSESNSWAILRWAVLTPWDADIRTAGESFMTAHPSTTVGGGPLLGLAYMCDNVIPTAYTSPTGYLVTGWNLVSIPAVPANPDPLVVLAGVDVPNASLQFWDNSSCEGYTRYGSVWGWTGPMRVGTSYWLHESGSPKTLSFQGYEIIGDFEMTIPAHTNSVRWIMVGTPYPRAVSADRILFKNVTKRGDIWFIWPDAYASGGTSSIVESSALGWDAAANGFKTVTPLAFSGYHAFDPWWGYWILATDPGELKIKFRKP